MTYKEILNKLDNGSIIVESHYTKKIYRCIDNKNLTNLQYIKIRPLLKILKSEFGGITRHYYKLKENEEKVVSK